tara:strand:+ start:777 stop:1352 length:576 start_codon:yes stop_codon:yes gene_type:complete
MYKLYTDKTEIFECNIGISGASLDSSIVRLIIESDNVNLLYKGTIGSQGDCKVPIKKLGGLLGENVTGTLKLEVIADDTYFTPWESEFVVEASKQVRVEVKSQNKNKIVESRKPIMKVSGIKGSAKSISENVHILNIMKIMVKENINVRNLPKKKSLVNKIISNYISKNPIKESKQKKIINGIIKVLSKRK